MNPQKTYVVYATTNPGKIIEIRRLFSFYGISVSSLADFTDKKLDVEETGKSLGDNAIIKSQAFANELIPFAKNEKKFIVVSDDTGVFIDSLGGEPGIHVRRWKGYKMTDEEIIEHCIACMKDIREPLRTATFRTNLAVILVKEGKLSDPIVFEGELKGRILEQADNNRISGFPFESLFFANDWNKILGDLHRMSDEEKRKGYFNHRERAIQKAIPFIQKHLN